MKHLTYFLAIGALHADIIPGSLPTLAPFSDGFVEVTYNLALTSQSITPNSQFVLLDVGNFDHWETPSISYSLSVEAITIGINHFDDPNIPNLRFTYMDLVTLTGPQVLAPLAGFIFPESVELAERAENFATHAFQLEPIVAMTSHIGRHAIVVPESSTSMAALFLAGLACTNMIWKRYI